MMGRQVNQLVRLVDDLLEASRVTGGQIELRRQRIGLAEVVQTAVETASPLIDAARHRLTVTLPSQPLVLDADPIRLAQVLSNLLNNAAKYTDPGGEISLTASRDGLDAVLRVRDTGVGIAPEMLPRIFEMFTQLDRTSRRSQGGMGIGLALVHSLVTMHGGTVKAASAGSGLGSEFTVRLPLAQPDALDGDRGAALESRHAANGHGDRVLVVDDNHDVADSLAILLGGMGHDVKIAYDGPSALATVDDFKPSVVLVDLAMPGMDGLEVARRLRLRPRSKEMKLVALTGWGNETERSLSQQAGFDHHLTKPVKPEVLKELLAKV
jgi:CheY-like chemotaxis protein/two-component sensor histidine kinase